MKTSAKLVILTGILGFGAGFSHAVSIPICLSFVVATTLAFGSSLMCYLHGN